MKKTILTILKFGIFLALGVFLLYLAFKGIDFNKLLYNFKNANYLWVTLSVCCGVIAYFVRAHRWNLLIEPLGYKPSLINSYHSIMLGYTANFAFPRIGEITRCGTLSRTEKIPPEALIGTVIAERAFDLLSFIFLLIITFFLEIDFFGAFFKKNVFQPIFHSLASTFNFSAIIWIIIFSLIAILIVSIYTFRAQIKKITFVKKIGRIGKGVLAGAKTVLRIQRKKEFFVYTIVLWMLYYLMTYLVFFSISATSHLTPLDGLFILMVGTCGMVAPVQGGIGAFHSLVMLGLAMYGIAREDGLAYAVITHESQAIVAIILGGVSFLILFIKSHKRKTKEKQIISN